MLVDRTCTSCNETKPWDDDPFIRGSKASGFHSAQCWGCYNRAMREAKQKARTTPEGLLANRIRALTSWVIKNGGYTKDSKTKEYLGCDWQTLKLHMEKQFLPGMSWDNIDKWHIDHVIPVCAARTEDEVRRVSHYTNLRPLWGADNLSKGGSYDQTEADRFFGRVPKCNKV
jgi:hypothetical protein